MKIRWTKYAFDNLKDVTDYISQDSTAKAKEFVKELIIKIHLLNEYPMLGRVINNLEERQFVLHRNYSVIYKIEGENVIILQVFHSMKNRSF